jgi:hypothetical protein
MGKPYTHDKKVKLANKISKVKKKSDMIKIFEILYEDNQSLKENKNGIFMYFHKLNNKTYHKLDTYLKQINSKENYYTESVTSPTSEKLISESQLTEDSESCNSSSYTKSTEYKPYTQDEFPSQKGISAKFKYSNKEKNLIKRKRYDDHINTRDENIIYCEFDVNNVKESN